MRKSNFMAGSVGGTAEDRKKANAIANFISGFAIVAFMATLLVVTKTFQTPAYNLAEEYADKEINLTSITEKAEKSVSFYTVDGVDKTMIDLLEWTEYSFEELDEFLASVIDAFDNDDIESLSLDQLNIAVIDNGRQNVGFETENTAVFTKAQLIEFHNSIRSQS
jgi:hypothetical protein